VKPSEFELITDLHRLKACLRRQACATLALLAGVPLCGIRAAPSPERVTWKPVAAAVLKMDERPVKLWNVYRGEKKGHLILVQLGQRYLMLDTQAQEVWEIDAAALKRKGEELLWERPEKPAAAAEKSAPEKAPGPKALPAEGWAIRDAGRARIVRVKLATEGRVLEVQLPAQPRPGRIY
jgi:hypothetical protein